MQPEKHKASAPKNIKFNYKFYLFDSHQYSLFLYYNHTHPVEMKTEFVYGHVRIFSDSKLYSNEISSKHHLNSAFEWDRKFFSTLIQGFEEFQIARKDEADEDDSSLELLIYQNKGDIKETLLKVGLVEDFGKDTHKQFWREFNSFNEYKANQIQLKEEENKQLAEKRKVSLNNLVKFQDQCEEQRKVLLGRLSAIFREKVNKLSDFGQEFTIKSLTQKIKDYQRSQSEPPQLMSTLQEQRAFNGSLFEPSQNFYQ